MKTISKIKIICFLLICGALALGYFYNTKLIKARNNDNEAGSIAATAPSQPAAAEISQSQTSSSPLPSSYLIANVPFVSQAPFANWDHLHEEACEEASLAIIDYYLNGKSLSAQQMEEEIQKLDAWELSNFGKNDLDLTVAQEKILAQNVFGLNPTIVNLNSIDDIKKEIAAGHIVIVPAAGQSLGNPNFTAPGPVYHMVVVIGYTAAQIITNDVGTRNGQNFKYSNSNFWNAIHDWSGSASSISSGQKVMMVF